MTSISNQRGGLRMKDEKDIIDEDLSILKQKITVFHEHVKGFQKEVWRRSSKRVSVPV